MVAPEVEVSSILRLKNSSVIVAASKLKGFLLSGHAATNEGSVQIPTAPPEEDDLHARTTAQLKRMGDKSAELQLKRSLLERGEKLEQVAVATQQMEMKSSAFLEDVRAYRKKKGV